MSQQVYSKTWGFSKSRLFPSTAIYTEFGPYLEDGSPHPGDAPHVQKYLVVCLQTKTLASISSRHMFSACLAYDTMLRTVFLASCQRSVVCLLLAIKLAPEAINRCFLYTLEEKWRWRKKYT